MTSTRTASTIRIILVISILLAAFAPAAAAIASERCPGGTATPEGCTYQPDRDTTCAWPLRLVRVGFVAICIRLGASR